jgi:hypothetical protein
VSQSATATCASCRGVCVMVCRSVCQKEADDRGATRVLLFFLQQWTKPGLVSLLPVVMISLFSLLFVLSLVLSFPFAFHFCLLQYSCSFCLAVFSSTCFRILLISFCHSCLVCASLSILILFQFAPFLCLFYYSVPILLSRPLCPSFPHFNISASSCFFTFVVSVS